MPAKVYIISGSKSIQVVTSCIVFVEPNATIALDASVHFMVNKRSQVLIPVCPLFVVKSPDGMPRHYGHVLKVA